MNKLALSGVLVVSFFSTICHAQQIITDQNIVLSETDNGHKEYKAQQEVHLKHGYQFSANANNQMHAHIDESLILPTEYSTSYTDATFDAESINTELMVGATTGSAGVSPSGAATYTIPIAIPKGTNGMQPNLSLNYNSQSGNGLLGYGWHLSGLSAITRSGKTHYHNSKVSPVTLSNADRYMLDGQYLIPISGENGAPNTEYATESETYAKVTSIGGYNGSPKTFKVEHKNGLVFYYGSVMSARQILENNKILAWHLYKVIDHYGNYMTYHYSHEGGQFRLNKIRYTANDDVVMNYHSEVRFNYSERKDQSENYVAGNKLETKYLLRNIQTFTNGKLLRKYHFEHSFNTYSYLKSVTEQGAFGEQLNATRFMYPNVNHQSVKTIYPSVDNSSGLFGKVFHQGDFNGDGLTDFLALKYFLKDSDRDEGKYVAWGIYLNSNNGYTYHNLSFPSATVGQNGDFKDFDYTSANPISEVKILIGDLNGDNKDDIVYGTKGKADDSTEDDYFYRAKLSTNNSTGYTFSNSSTIIKMAHRNVWEWITVGIIPTPYRIDKRHVSTLIDYDGDGRMELFALNSYTRDWRICSFDGRINYWHDSDEENQFNLENHSVFHFDYDGDGASEILYSYVYPFNGVKTYYYMIDFNSENLDLSTKSTSYYESSNFKIEMGYTYSSPIDFNGDGLSDIVFRNNSIGFALISKGYQEGQQLSASSFELMNFDDEDMYKSNRGIFYIDINSDGNTDILNIKGGEDLKVLISKGTLLEFESYTLNVEGPAHRFVNFDSYQIADLGSNGIGIMGKQDEHPLRFHKVFIKTSPENRQLDEIKDGFNNDLSFDYNKLTDYDNYTKTANWGNYPTLNFSSPLSVVSATHSSNGLGGVNTTNYSYKDAILHKRGKSFLGFQQTTVKNETTGSKTEAYNAFHPTWNVPYLTLSKSYLNDSLISQSETDYYFNDLNNQRYSILPKTITATNHLQGFTTVKDFIWSTEGNLDYEKTNIHNGLEVMEGEYEYEQHGSHIKNVRTASKITTRRQEQDPFVVNTAYTYYESGDLKQRLDFVGMPKEVKTQFDYDAFGNLSKKTKTAQGLSNQMNRYFYDNATARYLTKTINPLGYTIQSNYHQRFGLPISTKDELGKTTTYDYDAFGKLIKTTKPNGQIIEQNTEWAIDGNQRFKLTQKLDNHLLSTTWHDALGRELKSKVQGRNQYVWTSKSYNNKGQVTQQTLPHFEDENPLITLYMYDDFGRVSKVLKPYNDVSVYNYTFENAELTTSVLNTYDLSQQSTTKDASGKIIKKEDEGGEVSFSYYSHGQQQDVKVNGQVVASMTYDDYTRQTVLADANAGNTTYEYDAYGQLISQTDAKGQTISMTYDALARVLTKNTPEGQSVYTYYNTGGGTGQIKKAQAPNGNFETYQYDEWGRLNKLREHIAGTNYNTEYHYNNKHQLKKTTYPTGFNVTNTYDNRGYLKTVKANGNQLIFTAEEENALGQYTKYQYANGMHVEKTYNSLGMPTNYYCDGIQDMSFDFDIYTGNLYGRTDHLKELHESFQYDDLQRLTQHIRPHADTSMNVSLVGLSEGYTYFDNGNIKKKTDVSSQDYQYHPTKPHALLGVNDVINPVASLQEQSISYNSAQDPISISENAYTLNFEYGPHNNRVRSVLSHDEQEQQTKTYLSNMEILEVGDTTTYVHYIPGGDGLAAIYVEKEGENGQYYYVFKDHLGSILTLADKNGDVMQEQSFDAWGRYRNTEDWSYEDVSPPTLADGDFTWLRGYTGHEYLPQFSLIHMNGRLYDPMLGRMLSPDNYVHTDFGTQGYNRYSYAMNNSLKYTDPSGEIVWAPIIIGAVVGAYIGGSTANGTYNPGQWDYSSGQTWAGMGIGLVAGGLGGGIGVGSIGGLTGLEAVMAGGVVSGGINGAGMTALAGGDFGDVMGGMIQGAVIGGFTAAVGYGAFQGMESLIGNIPGHNTVSYFTAASATKVTGNLFTGQKPFNNFSDVYKNPVWLLPATMDFVSISGSLFLNSKFGPKIANNLAKKYLPKGWFEEGVIDDISGAKLNFGINDKGDFGLQLDYWVRFPHHDTYTSTNAIAWLNQYVTINPLNSIYPLSLSLTSSNNYYMYAGMYINLLNNR